ncbi:MAG: hypothetical protein IIA41_06655, partial [SAR324 cluster bacterium]|nr:hypothetical protein [SAR324 cluster bacterium]
LSAIYLVERCTAADCSSLDLLASGTLNAVALNTIYTYQIDYDSGTSTFTFTLNGDSANAVTVDAGALGAPFSAGANNPFIYAGVRGSGNPVGSMSTAMDDFRCKGCTVP